MSDRRKLQEAIQKIAGTDPGQAVMIIGTVVSVNIEERTCDVVPVNDTAETMIPDVSLLAENSDGQFLIPEMESSVVVLINKKGLAFVVLCSDLKKVEMYAEKYQFNSGDFGGLVKVKELTEKINTLENDLNTLKQAISTWIPVPNDGGAALKTALASYYGTAITVTTQTEIENKKVTHG